MHPHQYAASRSRSGMPKDSPDTDCVVAPPSPARAPQAPRAPPNLDDEALLTSAQTRARIGNVTTMCIWRWMRDSRVRFPQPVKINSRNYWRLGDLRRWKAEHASERP